MIGAVRLELTAAIQFTHPLQQMLERILFYERNAKKSFSSDLFSRKSHLKMTFLDFKVLLQRFALQLFRSEKF